MYKIHENIAVYNSLRQEILQEESLRRTTYLYLFSIYAGIFILGIQYNKYCFLIEYVIIIPLQIGINLHYFYMIRLSTYIKVFFEKDRNDINWESTLDSNELQEFTNIQTHKRLSSKVYDFAPIILGLTATASFIYKTPFKLINTSIYDNILNIFTIFISIVLLGIIIYINLEMLKYDKCQ